MQNVTWDDLAFQKTNNITANDIIQKAIDLKSTETANGKTSLLTKKEHLRCQGLHYAQKSINKFNHLVKKVHNIPQGSQLIFQPSSNREDLLEVNTKNIPDSSQVSQKTCKLIDKVSQNYDQANEMFKADEKIAESRRKKKSRLARIALHEAIKLNTYLKQRKSKKRPPTHKSKQSFEDIVQSLAKDDPEAAAKLIQEYELKRAEARILSDSHARKMWGKMARRYGGRDIEKTISQQITRANEEKMRNLEILKQLNTDNESDEDSEDNEDIEVTEKTIQDKFKRLSKMKFFKDAEELKQAKKSFTNSYNFDQAEPHPDDTSKLTTYDFESEYDELIDALQSNDKATKTTEHISMTECTPCRNSGGNQPIDSEELARSTGIESIKSITVNKRGNKNSEIHEKALDLLDNGVPEDDDGCNSKYFKFCPVDTVEVEHYDNVIRPEDEVATRNKDLLNLALSLNDDSFELDAEVDIAESIREDIKAKCDEVIPDYQDGWGSWTCDGFVDPKVEQRRKLRSKIMETSKVRAMKALKERNYVQIHKKACSPSDTYVVKKNSKLDQTAIEKLQTPISSDFVPDNVTRFATMPSHKAISGRAITALKLLKD